MPAECPVCYALTDRLEEHVDAIHARPTEEALTAVSAYAEARDDGASYDEAVTTAGLG